MKKKLRVGVTGGMGGGKSSFCNYILKKGYTVLFADEISKEILVKNNDVREKVIQIFGKEIYTNGKLNPAVLAETVFNNLKHLKKLNSIVHPVVISELNKLMKEVLKKHSIVFVEAALIYEAEMEELFDYIIVVTADKDIKKKRLAVNGIDEEEYDKRTSFQIPDEKKIKKADFVFENNYDLTDLQSKADIFLRMINLK